MYRIVTTTVGLFLMHAAWACGVCGGGFTGTGLGTAMPMLNQNLSGIQMQMSQYTYGSNLTGTEVEGYESDFYFSSVASFRKGFKEKNFFQAKLPYVSNMKKESGLNEWVNGVGDIQVSLQRIILNQVDSASLKNHILLMGYSSQLPTGKYMLRNSEKQLIPMGLQPGTGSWNHSVDAQYAFSGVRHGLGIFGAFTLSTENEMFYKPGALSQFMVSYLNRMYVGDGLIMPQVGVSYFNRAATKFIDQTVPNTAYAAGLGQASVDAFIGQWWIHAQVGVPFWEKASNLQPNQNFQAQVGVSFFWK